ncbi:MAG: putative porin [Prevotella sp.]|nr:putative porin [Prevotella sp.]
MKRLFTLLYIFLFFYISYAQEYNEITNDGTFTAAGYQRNKNFGRSDSIQGQHKEIPKGLKVWTIDERFGDRMDTQPDTLSHMFMNTIFTTGLHGEYNTLGNVGSPRINRIFIDRADDDNFMFTMPYDFFLTPVNRFFFTNTYSPITNLSYNSCGDRTNGEDHFKAFFAVNAGKRVGLGFKFDYIYGRGYYSDQSTSHFDYSMYGSYLGDRYQAHLLMSTNHQKVAENGGISNDTYITHPEAFNENYSENEIPTILEQNWNRNDNQHLFFNQRYSIGFRRKVLMTKDEIEARKFAVKAQKEQEANLAKRKAQQRARLNGEEFDEEEYDREIRSAGRPANATIAGNEPEHAEKTDSTRILVDSKAVADSLLAISQEAKEDTTWLKDEYVPVTSFIHTATFDNYKRIYEAYQTPADYYLNEYYNVGRLTGDSIYDKTRHWDFKNTVAIALLEGFNKWAKAGLKAFASYDIRHYALPDAGGGMTSFNENALSIGGQLSKTQGSLLHYNVTGEVGITGADAGEVKIDADADLNFKLFGDTVQLAAKGFFHRVQPTFYYRHYQSRHFWWSDDDLDNVIHTRIEGLLTLKRTRTQLRLAVDELKNYTYFGQSYDLVEDNTNYLQRNTTVNVRQASNAINLFTLQLRQDFTLGPLNWENELTYQRSSDEDVIAVPALNLYTNLYLRFKIARVLKCDFGADMRYFTKYYAPEYNPAIGQFTVQENEENRVKLGNYPIINVYANFHLKHTRFFVMFSHVNAGDGGNSFLTPHYPINQRLFRFGLSWNFFN